MRVDTASDAHNITFQTWHYLPIKIGVKLSPEGGVHLFPIMGRPKRAELDFMLKLRLTHNQGPWRGQSNVASLFSADLLCGCIKTLFSPRSYLPHSTGAAFVLGGVNHPMRRFSQPIPCSTSTGVAALGRITPEHHPFIAHKKNTPDPMRCSLALEPQMIMVWLSLGSEQSDGRFMAATKPSNRHSGVR